MLTKIGDTISLIDTEALGRPRVVAAYLVRGKERALIDMGYRSSAKIVINELMRQGVGPDELEYLMPTHVHLDHSGSCGTLAKKFPRATILVHPVGAPHLSDPTRLVKGASELFGNSRMRKYGLPEPIKSKRIRVIQDEEVVDLGQKATLRAIWTPGHASHHLSYALEGGGLLFTGDAVSVNYPDFPVMVPTTPPPSFDLDQAIASLDRISGFSPSKLLTPHFGEVNHAGNQIKYSARLLVHWNHIIQKLIAEGSSTDEMAEALVEEVCRRAGRSRDDLPEHLRVSIGVDVLGFVRYLQKKFK